MPADTLLSDFYDRLYRQNERVMKFGLEAISRAVSKTDFAYPHFLIAGTNGKGYVSALIANAAFGLGYRTGLFTSPHLVDFRERMRIDGRLPAIESLLETGWQVLREFGGNDCREFSGTTLTYFECCLVMALRLFRQNHVNLGVFEVGLGGRLDATNILSPGISVITSIGLDHQNYLGNTPAEIAHEKAGIMRPGCPVVCGRQQIETLRKEATIYHCSSFDALGETFDWQCSGDRVELVTPDTVIPMNGALHLAPYQRDNAAVAFFTLLKAHEIGLIQGDLMPVLSDVISRTRWVGRMYHCDIQTAQKYGVQNIILDGSHNPDAVKAFTEAVLQKDAGKPHAILVNSCRDKAIERMFPQYLTAFAPDEIFVTPGKQTPRMCSPNEYCMRAGLKESQACQSFDEAIEKAAKIATSQGTIYISGSLYLIGESIERFGETAQLETIMNDMDGNQP